MQRDQLDCARRMCGGGASSSRGAGSLDSLAKALEAAEERLHEALADGLAQVSFKVNWLILIELLCFHLSHDF